MGSSLFPVSLSLNLKAFHLLPNIFLNSSLNSKSTSLEAEGQEKRENRRDFFFSGS